MEDDPDPQRDPEFLAWVQMHEFLIDLARQMREDAMLALAAAQRLDCGA